MSGGEKKKEEKEKIRLFISGFCHVRARQHIRMRMRVCNVSPDTHGDNCIKVEGGPNRVFVLSEVSAI